MEWDQALQAYSQINIASGDRDFVELRSDLIKYAINYARIRADWQLSDIEQRIAMDDGRTIAHNCLISACNVLARYMEQNGLPTSWRQLLGEDRKDIGDFACYLHAMLGIQAR